MDLTLAALFVLFASVLALVVGFRIGRSASNHVQLAVEVLVLIFAVLYFAFLWDRPAQTRVLPVPTLIMLGNWHAMMACFFAGVYLATAAVSFRRRMVVGPATLVLSGYSIVAPILGSPPVCSEVHGSQILITQSTKWTCSPAAGASLLRLYGIEATEAQMADLCLTRQGTHWQGLYRGLKVMTEGTPWDVVARRYSTDEVVSMDSMPAILSVNMNTAALRQREHGFHSSVGHTVLALRSRPSQSNRQQTYVTVFDPSPNFGIEAWGPELLESVEYGVVLRLVPRNAATDAEEIFHRVARVVMAEQEIAFLVN